MSTQTLRSYFENPDQQLCALEAVAQAGWLVPSENLDLYDASLITFDPGSSVDEAFGGFERIYKRLAGPNWQVFRPNNPARDCWPPRQIFETIKSEFQEFSWRGLVNLQNFRKSGTGPRLESCLAKMQGIKPKKGYPHMTVSKFLHFYNPGLFPIYDNEVIWEKVFKHFENDFRVFCESAKIPYDRAINDDTETFLLHYMDWASSLLSVAHGTFMHVFLVWLNEQSDTVLRKRRFDSTTLYATAFEFTAIGATEASKWWTSRQ
jgi:hypothetical protein